MIAAASCSAAYVDPFARTWPGFSTTDPDSNYILNGLSTVDKLFFRSECFQVYFIKKMLSVREKAVSKIVSCGKSDEIHSPGAGILKYLPAVMRSGPCGVYIIQKQYAASFYALCVGGIHGKGSFHIKISVF